MPIGTEDGEFHEDNFSLTASQLGLKAESMLPSTASQKPAGGLKPQEGTEVAPTFWDKLKDTWPAKMVDSVKDFATLPGDVYSGKTSADSPEFMDRVGNASTLMAGMGWGAADLKPGLGLFGGRFTKSAVSTANKMMDKGMSDQSIKEFTGLEVGADGFWRREFSDKDAKFSMDKIQPNEFNDKYGYARLGEVLDHPKLYEAYPEAKDIGVHTAPVVQGSPNIKGSYLGANPLGSYNLELRKDLSPTEARETVLHEIQHWIQDVEGFVKGGNRNTVKDSNPEFADQYKGYLLRKYNRPEISQVMDAVDKGESGEAERLAHNLLSGLDRRTYRALAGEVEAFNVMRRSQMSDKDIKFSLGKETEDVPRKEQIKVDWSH